MGQQQQNNLSNATITDVANVVSNALQQHQEQQQLLNSLIAQHRNDQGQAIGGGASNFQPSPLLYGQQHLQQYGYSNFTLQNPHADYQPQTSYSSQGSQLNSVHHLLPSSINSINEHTQYAI